MYIGLGCLKPLENSSSETCTALKNASASCALGNSVVILYNKATDAVLQRCKNIWNSISRSEKHKAECCTLDPTRVTKPMNDQTASPTAKMAASVPMLTPDQEKDFIYDRLASRTTARSKSDPGFPTKQAGAGIQGLGLFTDSTVAVAPSQLVDANSKEALPTDKNPVLVVVRSDSAANLPETGVQELPKEHEPPSYVGTDSRAASETVAVASTVEAETTSMQTDAEHSVPTPPAHNGTSETVAVSSMAEATDMQVNAGIRVPLQPTVPEPQTHIATDNSSASETATAASTSEAAAPSAEKDIDNRMPAEGQTVPTSQADVQPTTNTAPSSQQTDDAHPGPSTEPTMPAAQTEAPP